MIRFKKNTLLKPPSLNAGDTIGIISPASPISTKKRADFNLGIEKLKQKGYAVQTGKHALNSYGYLAGQDQERMSDLHDMIADPQIKALFSSRGGYGLTRLLPFLDYRLLQKNPKIIIGYSDLTALSLALFSRIHLVTFHGPMVAPNVNDMSEKMWNDFFACVQGFPQDWQGFDVLVPGRAQGRLLCGCLSIFDNLIGTPHMPDVRECILLLEDVQEPLYKIDRMFSHLYNAGILQKINGLILGQFVNCDPDENDTPITLQEIIKHYTTDLHIPIIQNFAYGHLTEKYTIPFGCKVLMDTESLKIELLESGVIYE